MRMHNVLEFLERSVDKTPDAVAVEDGITSLTYRELMEHARFAGARLGREGIAGRPTMVVAEKGSFTLAAFFGVLYAGGFYVPVDPHSSKDRLQSVYGTLGAPLVLVDENSASRVVEEIEGVRTVTIASLFEDVAPLDEAQEEALAEMRRGTIDEDPVYVLFTSGSTGVPKGVAVSHRAVIDFIEAFAGTFDFTAEDIIANQAPFDFDVSVKDIYTSMCVGATLSIIPRPLFSQPAALVECLNQRGATIMIWAVAALCLVSNLHGLDHADLSSVRKVLFSGETMPMRHLATWMERLPEAQFVNLYGPTEITCNCTYHVVEDEREYPNGLPLGLAFANRVVKLLDEQGNLVTEPGVEGEICVCGSSLANGYYAAPEQTARAFVDDPTSTALPRRMYRTGDLACFNEQGEMFFRGRKDNQIKHLGHRIELEEIEKAIEKLDGVTRCRSAFDSEKSQIHAFYEGEAEERALMAIVVETLPVFMVPSSLTKVEDMPLTKNGKVDRKLMLANHLEARARAKAERKARLAAKKAAKAAKAETKETAHE